MPLEIEKAKILAEKRDKVERGLWNIFQYIHATNHTISTQDQFNVWGDLLELHRESLELKDQGFPTPEAAVQNCEYVAECISYFLASVGKDVFELRNKIINGGVGGFASEINVINRSLLTMMITASGATINNLVPFDAYLNTLISCLKTEKTKLIFYINFCIFSYGTLQNQLRLREHSSQKFLGSDYIYNERPYHHMMTFINRLNIVMRECLPVQDTEAFQVLNDAQFSSVQDSILQLLRDNSILQTDVFYNKIEKSQEINHLLRHIDECQPQRPMSLWTIFVAMFGDGLTEQLLAIRNNMQNMILIHLQQSRRLLDLELRKLINISDLQDTRRIALEKNMAPLRVLDLSTYHGSNPAAKRVETNTEHRAAEEASELFEDYVCRGAKIAKEIREESERRATEDLIKIRHENEQQIAKDSKRIHEENDKRVAEEAQKAIRATISMPPAPQTDRPSIPATSFTFFGQNKSANGVAAGLNPTVSAIKNGVNEDNSESDLKIPTESDEDLLSKLISLTVENGALEKIDEARQDSERCKTARMAHG